MRFEGSVWRRFGNERLSMKAMAEINSFATYTPLHDRVRVNRDLINLARVATFYFWLLLGEGRLIDRKKEGVMMQLSDCLAQ